MTPTRTIAVPSSPVDDDSAVTARSASVGWSVAVREGVDPLLDADRVGFRTVAVGEEGLRDVERAGVDVEGERRLAIVARSATHSESRSRRTCCRRARRARRWRSEAAARRSPSPPRSWRRHRGAGIAVVGHLHHSLLGTRRKYASASMAQRSAGSTAVLGTSEVDASGGGHRSVLPADRTGEGEAAGDGDGEGEAGKERREEALEHAPLTSRRCRPVPDLWRVVTTLTTDFRPMNRRPPRTGGPGQPRW